MEHKDAEQMHSPEIIDPKQRLKHLIDYSNSIEVEPHIPPTRYYRSGLEMVRMANVYYNEGALENAYVLYLKFMTLFLEKIRKHPQFHTVPVQTKAINQSKLREVLPKAEQLREQLLKQYELEYNRYLAELREKRRRAGLRSSSNIRPLDIDEISENQSPMSSISEYSMVSALEPLNIDDISYPDPDDARPSGPHGNAADASSHSLTPSIDRSKKPDIYSPTYARARLRPVIVPSDLMRTFLDKSKRNTLKNIETCGILAGKLSKNELIITHMILPKQKGTPDSCTTMNEEEIFDYQDQHNLITIGWIHTHPTQTAFLSSVDLHTHCPYQLLMPEAIAIVCAPKYNETGFFVLTQTYGLQFISTCTKSGFHPHPTEPPLFKVAEHVRIEESVSCEVLDLRT